jgi:hypothetical protein
MAPRLPRYSPSSVLGRSVEGVSRYLDVVRRYVEGVSRYLCVVRRYVEGVSRYLCVVRRYVEGVSRYLCVVRRYVEGVSRYLCVVRHSARGEDDPAAAEAFSGASDADSEGVDVDSVRGEARNIEGMAELDLALRPHGPPRPTGGTLDPMPSKRDVLSRFSRDELLAVVDRFELAPPDRRGKDGLLETIAASKKATLTEIGGRPLRESRSITPSDASSSAQLGPHRSPLIHEFGETAKGGRAP